MNDSTGRTGGPRVLAVATMSQSLALQSPASWDVLNEAGADITFAAARDEWSSQLDQWGRFVEMPGSRRMASLDHVRFVRAFRELLARDQWDLIQLQTPIASTLARVGVGLGKSDAAVVYVAHGFHFHQDASPVVNAVVGRLERVLARRSDAVAMVAEEDHRAAAAMGMDRHTLLWRLPGAGVDTAAFATASPTLPFGKPHLLFCGDMIPRKNPAMVVDTALELLDHEHAHPLVMIGQGPLLRSVLSIAAPLQQRGLFLHVPRTDDVAGYLTGAGAHLLPSLQEGVPRVTLEAMSAQVPTVAMSNRGSRELAARGAGPLMARGATAQQWADSVSSVFGSRLDHHVATSLEFYGLEHFRREYRRLLLRIGVVDSRP